jgi:hypothetical protein
MVDQKTDGEAPRTRRQFEDEIILKAWKDPEYKKRLLASPKEVLEEEIAKIRPGTKLPDSLKVYVNEESRDAVYISLPVNPEDYRSESSSDEAWMEDVAGGFFLVAFAYAYALAAQVQLAANVNAVGNTNVTTNVNANVNVNVSVNTTS